MNMQVKTILKDKYKKEIKNEKNFQKRQQRNLLEHTCNRQKNIKPSKENI